MARNKLADLNNHLFEQLERLNDEDLKGEDLDREIKRSKAMGGIAKNIVQTASLALNAQKYYDEFGNEGRGQILDLGYTPNTKE